MISEAHRKANKKWNDANVATRYDRLVTLPPAGSKAIVQAAAKLEDISVSLLIQRAILEYLRLDAWPT